ncbi:leucyl-tRNA synthetase [Mycoplasmopsis arginini]|nr:leucyl-tRNA synthetase [Chlamydia trachomatis]SGA03192.1 leucyl-tRNA synthetase [Chlamydia abortus]SGA25068.1 leucyl-tRNA synthetase [Mycoplasmopsis arginini]CRH55740.1 leucyl-tRNA synthetase [Chlamydia trachomatis]SGA27463.1 leucyl-tRNA synthetase [Mycoplasmopsis arginini]
MSAIVISPEHPLLLKICSLDNKKSIQEYLEITKTKNELERTQLNKEKSGLFTGAYVIHPLTNEKIQI